MAGDKQRSQNQINYQGNLAQNELNNTRNRLNNQYSSFYNNYQTDRSADQNLFNNAQGQYDAFNNRNRVTADPRMAGNVDEAISGYKNFAATGGFSPQDIQNIRARSIAPTRSVYANAAANAQRANTLAGGNMANAGAVQAKLAREQGQAVSDANVGANANIAQMVQQGKLAGTSGLNSAAQQQEQFLGNLGLANYAQDLAGAKGLTDLYGTTPGREKLSQSGILDTSREDVASQALQNQLSLGMIGAQQGQRNQNPNYLGNISSIFGMMAPFLGGGGGNSGNEGPYSTQE